MRRSLLLGALVAAAMLPASAAQAADLYSTMSTPNDVQGANSEFANNDATRIAQAFVPAQNGTARLVSVYGQTLFQQGAGQIQISIYTNSSGHPGSALATGGGTIQESTGASPTCMKLSAPTALTAGQTYWAVFRAVDKPGNWLFWHQQARQVLFSSNGGSTWAQSGVQKTFSLRVEDNLDCGPDITPNPAAGVELGDMYAKPGGTAFNTIYVQNDGNQNLTLTGASFSGAGASSFRLLRGEPTGPDNLPFAFPRTIGTGGGAILYVVCNGAAPDGQRTATLTLTSNDPDESSLSWPVRCIVDTTPPSIAYTQAPNGQQGWFVTAPANLTAQGIDPESGNRVKRIFCSDTLGPPLDFNAGSITTFHISGDGIHQLSCQATDVANNTSAAGAFPVTVKLDTTAPATAKGAGPPAVTSGRDASFGFSGSDATSGVAGLECSLDNGAFAACTSPASRSGVGDGVHTFSVRARDVAGNVQAAATTWSWRVDTVAPNTSLGGGPASPTTAATATFSLAGDDIGGSGVSRIECALDGAAFTTCPVPLIYNAIGEGHHQLAARAVDQAGNPDPTPAVQAWDVDRTAPTARVANGPVAHTAATSATFTLASDGEGPAATVRYECRLDGAPFATCASPLVLTGLEAERDHRLDVRAVDALGNVQDPPTAFTWTISTKPFAADDRAATTADHAVDVAVLGNDVDPLGGSLSVLTFTPASVQGGTVSQSGNGLRYTPAPGFTGTDTFTYKVRSAGGRESNTATVTVVVSAAPPPPLVDTTPVGPPLVTGSGNPVLPPPAKDTTKPVVSKVRVKAGKLTFRLSETAKVTVVVEELVKGRKKPVRRSSTKVAGKLGTNTVKLSKKLKRGRYRVTVKATDAAGNRAKDTKASFTLKR